MSSANQTPGAPDTAAGTHQPQRTVSVLTDPREKSPFLAGILSAMPGLGQVYVGYYRRGFLHAVIVAGLITLLSTGDMDELTPLFALFLAFFWLYNMIDAVRRAALYNQVLAGGEQLALPDDLSLPGLGGSLAGGLTLAAIGVILLLHTRFDVSLAWIGDWWPAALILFGLYLAIKSRMEAPAARPATADDDAI